MRRNRISPARGPRTSIRRQRQRRGRRGAPAGGGGGGRGGGGPMTVKQTATELSVETQGRNGPQTRTYKLDGSETEMAMGQMTAKVSAKWDGSKLVITTKTDNGEQTQTWSL